MSEFDLTKFDNYILNKIVRPLVVNIIDNKKDIYRNTLDPFSALVDCMIRNCEPTTWKKQEEGRQIQKTLQNKIGELHEYTIDCFEGWENLDTGNVIDIVNHEFKIIAEIKNKHNTTKGNHKKDIYDDLEGELDRNYQNYTAYYVEILPKNGKAYNKNFTPSDNTRDGENRLERNDIRIVDGKSFYSLVSKDRDFIVKLYSEILPSSLKKAIDIINESRVEQLHYPSNIKDDPLFKEFIEKVFP